MLCVQTSPLLQQPSPRLQAPLPSPPDEHCDTFTTFKYQAFRFLEDLPAGWDKVQMILKSDGHTKQSFIARPTNNKTMVFTEDACLVVECALFHKQCAVELSPDGQAMHLYFIRGSKLLKSAHPKSTTAWVEDSSSFFMAVTEVSHEEADTDDDDYNINKLQEMDSHKTPDAYSSSSNKRKKDADNNKQAKRHATNKKTSKKKDDHNDKEEGHHAKKLPLKKKKPPAKTKTPTALTGRRKTTN